MKARALTILIADGARRLRVTVDVDPEPIDTTGETVIPGPPALPRECRPTVRPGLAKVIDMPRSGKRVA